MPGPAVEAVSRSQTTAVARWVVPRHSTTPDTSEVLPADASGPGEHFGEPRARRLRTTMAES